MSSMPNSHHRYKGSRSREPLAVEIGLNPCSHCELFCNSIFQDMKEVFNFANLHT